MFTIYGIFTPNPMVEKRCLQGTQSPALQPFPVFPIECKAGQTVAGDWFKPLQRFCQAVGITESALIYGGGENQLRSITPVFCWQSIQQLIERIFQTPAIRPGMGRSVASGQNSHETR